jgi:hypothetical protein
LMRIRVLRGADVLSGRNSSNIKKRFSALNVELK